MKKLVFALFVLGAGIAPASAQVQRTIRNLPTQCSAVPGHFESIMSQNGYKLQSIGALFPPTGTYEYYQKDNGGAFALFTRSPEGDKNVVCFIMEGPKVFYPPDETEKKPD